MAKRFTFKDAKEKIAQLEAELASVKNDLTDGDGEVTKTTHIVTIIGATLVGFFLGAVIF